MDKEPVIYRYTSISNLVLHKYRTIHKQDGISKYYLQSAKLHNATISSLM